MRVLFDHQVFSYQAQGGVSRHFAEVIRGLPRLGHEAVQGWRWSPNRYLPGPDLAGPSFKGKAALRAWLNARVSRRALRAAFDVFHPTYYDPYFLPLLGDRPFVLTIHDMTHELYPAGLVDAGLVPARKRQLAARAARVIAVSENTRADVVRLLGVPADKVAVVPHGNSLRPGTVSSETPKHNRPYWLYVGARHSYKDFAVFVEALGHREAGRRGESAVLIGGGMVTLAEAELLSRHGLEGNWLQTTCTEAELAGWYSKALALVYPSRYEGFGLPLLEAMAWDCPVVAARASSLPEVAGDAAVYFEAGNTEGLAQALEEVSEPARARELRTLGRVREAAFDWKNAVAKTAEVYRSCLESR